ncbi:MAG TPA: YifB family Mg chelatase-like AAA ATPase [Candidatus Limnocylindrales bacterium]|nr:YifB family Mg chelatase-like AAA ATPase [Candidatus Limnocylindrales bacterium]
MSYAKVLCAALVGAGGHVAEVEACVAPGLPAVIMTGLPDLALYESRERVRAAIGNSGGAWPYQRISVNLSPAYLRKFGSGFDLPIALAVLAADGQLPTAGLRGVLVVGELGLDGSVRPVCGVLPMVAAVLRQGVRRAIVPAFNASEAALVPGVQVLAARTLGAVIDFLRGIGSLEPPPPAAQTQPAAPPDLIDVAGQRMGRLAVEVAAAGGHHLAFFGYPGGGKTMLANRLPALLPELTDDEALEVTSIHSVAGALAPGGSLIRRPPLQAPHHTSSVAALVGGGAGLARPGALSLAHRGVLLLDEAPEFPGRALDALRQPLEEGFIMLGRRDGTVVYPAAVQLVLTANPCGCSVPRAAAQSCECSPSAMRRYRRRLSGPLLDRIDIQLSLQPVSAADLLADDRSRESSAQVAARVAAARATAALRWAALGCGTNAQVPGRSLRDRRWRLPRGATVGLGRLLDDGAVSSRGFDRVVRLAWTIADLFGRGTPGAAEVDLAVDLRRGHQTLPNPEFRVEEDGHGGC